MSITTHIDKTAINDLIECLELKKKEYKDLLPFAEGIDKDYYEKQCKHYELDVELFTKVYQSTLQSISNRIDNFVEAYKKNHPISTFFNKEKIETIANTAKVSVKKRIDDYSTNKWYYGTDIYVYLRKVLESDCINIEFKLEFPHETHTIIHVTEGSLCKPEKPEYCCTLYLSCDDIRVNVQNFIEYFKSLSENTPEDHFEISGNALDKWIEADKISKTNIEELKKEMEEYYD